MTLEEQIKKLIAERDAAIRDAKEQREISTKYEDRLFQAKAVLEQTTAERDEEKAIVDRVWAALGISTYEQAKPLAIDEHVKRIVEERDAAMKACAEMRDVLSKHHEWSMYQSKNNEIVYTGPLRAATEHAISSDCGKGYHHEREIEPLVHAIRGAQGECAYNIGLRGYPSSESPGWKACQKALAHAERLTGKETK